MKNLDLIIFLIFGIIGLLNWLFRKNGLKDIPTNDETNPWSSKKREPSEMNSGSSEEERMRKFMEALGIPSPPPVPKRISKQIPDTVVSKDSRLPKTRDYRKILQQKSEPTITKIEQPATPQGQTLEPLRGRASALEEKSKDAYEILPDQVRKEKVDGINVRSMLKSSENIRKAIVLREILGQPRSLQPF